MPRQVSRMSKLTELLDELCPDGVEYRPLGEVGEFLRGSSLQKKHLTSEGVPCIHYGQVYTRYGLSANETYSFLKPEFATGKRTMTTGDLFIATTSENEEDLGKAVAWLGQKEVVASNDAFIYRHNLDPMYVSYFFASSYFHDQKYRFITGTKVKRLSGDSMAKIIIPVPPLEVQQEIVRVLDAFTDLEQSLVSELELRKKQYGFHRDELLSFTANGGELCPDGVEYRPLGEVFDTRNGYTPSRSKPEFWVDEGIPWFRMDDIRTNGNVLDDSLEHISPEAVKGTVFPAGTVIVATSATIGEHALLKVPALSNQRFTALIAKPEFVERLLPEFIHYYCFVLDEWCTRNTTQSSFSSVDMPRFRKFMFPIPSIEVQQEIVAKLDTFDSLIESIEQEITLRRKQYEFYRDELLSFTPKED